MKCSRAVRLAAVLCLVVGNVSAADVAKAVEFSVPESEDFNIACDVVGGATKSLCVTMKHLADDDHDVLGFDSKDPSTDRAIDVISELLIDARQIDESVVLGAIKSRLLNNGNARRYCDALKADLPESMKPLADVACLRPACLVTADFPSIAKKCAPVTSSNRASLREKVALLVSRQPYGCAKPQKEGAICAVEEAAELVVKVDQLLSFAMAFRHEMPDPKACAASGTSAGCKAALTMTLESLGRTWSIGTVINEALQRNEPLRTVLDPQHEFQRQWSKVDTKIPPASAIAGQEVENFPFDIAFVRELNASRPAVEGVRTRLQAHVRQELLLEWKRAQTVVNSLKKVSTDLTAQCKEKLARLPPDIHLVDDRLVGRARQLQELTPCIDLATAELQKAQAKLPIAVVQDACAQGKALVSIAHGIADLCFDVKADQVGLIGMRFAFRPCAQLQDIPCLTTGDLRLLIRTKPQPNPIVVDYQLGISNISARISGNDITPVAIPPAAAYASPDLTLGAESLARLLPPTFALTQVDHVELGADMSVRISGIRISAAGIVLPPLCALLSSRSIAFGTDPDCTNASKASSSLAAAVRAALAAEISKKQLAFSLPGLPVQVARAKVLLGPTDRCPDGGGPLSDMAIASMDDLIAICGSISLPLSDNVNVPIGVLWQSATKGTTGEWRIIGDEAKVRAALQERLGKEANIDVIAFRSRSIELQASVTKGCRVPISISIADSGVQPAMKKLAGELANCALKELAKIDIPSFEFFGLRFAVEKTGPRFCLLEPKVEGGPVCMRNVQLRSGKPDFSRAVLEDQGRLAKLVKDQLQGVVPGAVTVQEVLPKLKLEVELPIVGPTLVELSPDSGEVLRKAAIEAFRSGLNKLVANKRFEAGPVSVIARSVKAGGGVRDLALAVDIEYGDYPLQATLHLLPTVRLAAPAAADALIGAITRLLPGVEIGGNKVYVLVGADGIPVVRCAIAMPIDLGGLKASGTVEWRPGKDQKPKFSGPISVMWTTYTPIFTGVDLGEITAEFDPSNENIALAASVALTSGDVTKEAMRFAGRLVYDKAARTVTADTGLFIGGMRFARSVGVANIKEESFEGKMTPEGAAAYLPLPEAQVGIYGKACMVSGRANIRLFKSFDLANVVAVIVLPDPCGDAKAAEIRQAKLVAFKGERCVHSGRSGLLCVDGKVNVASLFEAGTLIQTPLGAFSPVISVRGDAGFAKLDINASLKRIKVKADVEVVRVTVIFPSATGIDADLLRRLLANLLKPSIDWESLIKGDIVISPNTGKNGEAEEPDGGSKGDENGQKADASARTSGAKAASAATPSQPTALRPTFRGGGIKLGFNSGDLPLQVTDDGKLLQGDSPYYVQAIDKNGVKLPGWFPVRVAQATVKALRSSAQDSLSLVQGALAFEAQDRWYVLMCRGTPCAAGTFIAAPASIDGKSVSENEMLRPVPTIAGFIGLDAGSFGVAARTLPRLAQRALADGAKSPEMVCATTAELKCAAAIFRLQGDQQWSYFPSSYPSSVIVREGSFWHRAIQRLQPAQAMALIAATEYERVVALALGPDNAPRALLKRSSGFFGGMLFASRTEKGAFFLRKDRGTVIEVTNNSPGYALRNLEGLYVDDSLGSEPWNAPTGDSPLDKVLQALVVGDESIKLFVAASDKGDRATIRLQAATEADGKLIFAMRYRGRACNAVVKAKAEIATTLGAWSRPANFNDPEAGRIRQGVNLRAVEEELAANLLRGDSHEPFLIDPMFMFYPAGACP